MTMLSDYHLGLQDLRGRFMFIGELVIFSRPADGGGKGSTRLDMGKITKYNKDTGFISMELCYPAPGENKNVGTKYIQEKFFLV